MKANTKIKIKQMEITPFAENAEGPKLSTGNFTLTYDGDLKGEGILRELWLFHSDSYGEVYGLERITGSIAGKQGSFITEHKGELKNGFLTKKIKIINGSGTGDLKGIHGETEIHTGPQDEVPAVYEYSFE